MGPDEELCVAFTFNLYLTISERKFYRKVYNIFSEDRHRKANDNLFSLLITIFQSFTTNMYVNTATYNFKKKKKRQPRARKADESVRFRIEENSFIF